MKVLTVAGIPTLLVLCVGMAISQDAAHDADKAATKTGHAVKHATKKIGNATKTGAKDIGHGAEVTAKDAGKGVRPVQKRPAMALRMRLTSSQRSDRKEPGESSMARRDFYCVSSKGEDRLARS